MADAYFRLTNTVAFAAWIVLLLLPGQRRVSGWLCAWVVPALLAASYAAISPRSSSSVAGSSRATS